MPPDFIICETPAMTFLRAATDKARDILRAVGQAPNVTHGTWGGAGPVVTWALSCGASVRTVDLEALAEIEGKARA